MARSAPSNTATNPSPVVATSRPRNRSSTALTPGVPGQQVAPPAVAELEGTGGGVHDVGYQERRHHSVEATALRTRERRTRLPVDRDPRLIPHHPGVVAGRNLVELAGLDQQLRTLTHPDPCAAG